MRRLDGSRDVAQDGERPLTVDPLFGAQRVAQRTAVEEFHHEKCVRASDAEVVDGYHIRVREGSRCAGFALKALGGSG